MNFLSAMVLNGVVFLILILALNKLEIYLDAKREAKKGRKRNPKLKY